MSKPAITIPASKAVSEFDFDSFSRPVTSRRLRAARRLMKWLTRRLNTALDQGDVCLIGELSSDISNLGSRMSNIDCSWD